MLNGNVVFDTADEAASVAADHDTPEEKLLRILSPTGEQPLGCHDTRCLDLLFSTIGGQPKKFQIYVYFRVGNNRTTRYSCNDSLRHILRCLKALAYY